METQPSYLGLQNKLISLIDSLRASQALIKPGSTSEGQGRSPKGTEKRLLTSPGRVLSPGPPRPFLAWKVHLVHSHSHWELGGGLASPRSLPPTSGHQALSILPPPYLLERPLPNIRKQLPNLILLPLSLNLPPSSPPGQPCLRESAWVPDPTGALQ